MSEDDSVNVQGISLPTFTHLWKIDGVVYTLGDFVLPMPVNIRSAFAAIVVFVPQMIAIIKLNLSSSYALWFIAIVISVLIGWMSDKPAFGGRTLTQVLLDYWSYYTSKKLSYDLSDGGDLGSSIFDGEVFIPENDEMTKGFH